MKSYERPKRRRRIHPSHQHCGTRWRDNHQRHPPPPMAIRTLLFCVWQTTGFYRQFGQLSRLGTRLATPPNSPQPRPPRTQAMGHYRRATSAASMHRIRERAHAKITQRALTARSSPVSTRKDSTPISFARTPAQPTAPMLTGPPTTITLPKSVWKGALRWRSTIYCRG